MGPEHVAAAGLYANDAVGSLGLESLPVHGTLRTASLTGVTDSAASGTVMATGTKTWNGHLGLDRDDNTLENLVELARSRGMSTGIVTTDRLSGATPSAFLVHTEDRFSYPEIAAEIAPNLPDVALAGGQADFADLIDPAAVDFVTTAAEMNAWVPGGKPLLGLFSDSTFPFVQDGYGDLPTLADLTVHAINALMPNPNGFFLMVEGARIDHASHADDILRAVTETLAFDEAITAGRALLDDDATVLVTADHECGGLHVISGNGAGNLPSVEWRYMWHTNTDVGVWASGPYTEVLDGERHDNAWVHAVLQAAVTQSDVTPPVEGALVDGWLGDLEASTVSQPYESSFDPQYNRLDALHVDANENGLRIGIDGVFEDDANAVVVYVDIDYGDSTGWPHDGALTDLGGPGDSLLSALKIDFADSTFGAERALISLTAEEALRGTEGSDNTGLRDLTSASDLGWLESAINFDGGNVSLFDAPAVDVGVVDEGFEAEIPWESLYGTTAPDVERRIAVVAVLVNDRGTWISNQALPAFASATEAGSGTATLSGEVAITVDGAGGLVGSPVAVP
jgi:alkaline phosphatase